MARIVNMTSSFKTGVELDLDLVETFALEGNIRSMKRTWHGVLNIKFLTPKCTAVIFTRGSVCIMGTTCDADALEGANLVRDLLLDIGYDTEVIGFSTSNYVGAYDFGHALHHEKVFNYCKTSFRGAFGSFEPELFPGLHLSTGANQKAIMFRSGKVIFTGCKSKEMVTESHEFVSDIVNSVNQSDDSWQVGL
jgi:TATA-box binding protein (TBP) (component of TFIID and TFIIIB)